MGASVRGLGSRMGVPFFNGQVLILKMDFSGGVIEIPSMSFRPDVNDFVGDYFGVRLGYSANTGYGTYGLEGEERDRMRGAMVFLVREAEPRDFETHMVYARDYGIR